MPYNASPIYFILLHSTGAKNIVFLQLGIMKSELKITKDCGKHVNELPKSQT